MNNIERYGKRNEIKIVQSYFTLAQLTDCTADLTAGLVCNWERREKKETEKCQRIVLYVKWRTIKANS